MLSAFVWLLLCIKDNRELTFSIREFFYLLIEEGLFLCCGHFLGTIEGFVIYLGITVCISYMLLKDDFNYLLEMSLGFIRRKKSRNLG